MKGDATHLARVDGKDLVVDAQTPEIRLRETGQTTLLWMGIRHILTGWDHLAFLIGLVIVGGRWKSILAAVTAFTVAHSITLGLATTGVVIGRPIFVEPAIALSVLYIGVENLRGTSMEGRWKITLPFGLIHGFGFAGALRVLDLPKARVPLALFSFNLGVEIGQLAVLAVVLPVLWVLAKSAAWRKWGVRGVSAVVAAAGALWFVARLAC
jgi:hydrogenase/urease accessory protein HupE